MANLSVFEQLECPNQRNENALGRRSRQVGRDVLLDFFSFCEYIFSQFVLIAVKKILSMTTEIA
jgi:hypothetical protein